MMESKVPGQSADKKTPQSRAVYADLTAMQMVISLVQNLEKSKEPKVTLGGCLDTEICRRDPQYYPQMWTASMPAADAFAPELSSELAIGKADLVYNKSGVENQRG